MRVARLEVITTDPSSRSKSTTARSPFTLFQASDINFSIVVYAHIMQVDVRHANLWDNGGQHGQESEEGEGKEKEDRQKEVSLRQHCSRHIEAETHQGACALHSQS